MKAIVLSAGRGERLRPYTDRDPKCLLSFAGRRLIDWQRAALATHCISDISVVTGYLSERFCDLGLPTWHNPRWAETNMVTSLLCARPALESGSEVIVAYGDIIYEPRVLAALMAGPGDIATVIDRNWLALWRARANDPLADAESLRLNGRNQIIDMGRKVRSLEEIEAQYIGLTRFTANGIEQLLRFYDGAALDAPWLMGRSRETCHMTDLLRGMIEAGHSITGAFTHGGWLEFDTIEDLTLYNRLLEESQLDPFLCLSRCDQSW